MTASQKQVAFVSVYRTFGLFNLHAFLIYYSVFSALASMSFTMIMIRMMMMMMMVMNNYGGKCHSVDIT